MFLNLQSKFDTPPPCFVGGAVSKEELSFESSEVMVSAFPYTLHMSEVISVSQSIVGVYCVSVILRTGLNT